MARTGRVEKLEFWVWPWTKTGCTVYCDGMGLYTHSHGRLEPDFDLHSVDGRTKVVRTSIWCISVELCRPDVLRYSSHSY